ncbi:MAG TPA: alpha/beta hydrolase [Candidatus Angelobacter sp.]|nr:alpha/beta hydrolase [Candidatus Angelobacter sp.]
MPKVKINGVELFYKESGSGRETIVFSHGLLMDHSMFEGQRAAFEGRYRVIAYDHRGQGQSRNADNDAGQVLDMETLTGDAAALIQALDAAPCHFAGLSMGGFIGLRLASRHSALVRTLTLMNTGPDREPWPGRLRYSFLASLVWIVGVKPFTGTAMKALFGETTRRDPAQRPMLEEWREKLRQHPRSIASALSGVMARREVAPDELRSITCPTLIIAGEEDTAQPPFRSERLGSFINGARLVRIAESGHSSSLEAPDKVTWAMADFLEADRLSHHREIG